MKKYILGILLFSTLTLNTCTTTLTDKSLNTFIATATQGSLEDRVEVKWIGTSYYKNFTVYRSESEDGLFEPITSKISADAIVDKDIAVGQEYFYKVQGFNDLGTPMFMTEAAIGYAGAKGGFYPPNNIQISSGQSAKSLKLQWHRVENAVKYTIYRGIDKENLSPIGETYHLSYTDHIDDVTQLKYYYSVSAFHKDGYDSQKSPPIQGVLFGGDIQLMSLEGEFTDKIRLTWKKLPYADNYMIYRSELKEDMGKLITNVSAKQYKDGSTIIHDDKSIDKNKIKVYYYTILFANKVGAQQKSQTVRGYLKTSTTLDAPNNVIVSQGISARDVSITWDAVDRAESYDILRSSSANGPWEVIGKSTTTSYNDNTLGKTYTSFYRVNAYHSKFGPGKSSTPKEGWAVRAPMNVRATDYYGSKINISWDAVPGAKVYTVYYSENKDDLNYKQASRILVTRNQSRINFVHDDESQLNIGTADSKELFYKIDVATDKVVSDTSSPIKGKIQKLSAPKDLKIIGNKQPTKSMTMVWKAVPNAKEYRIYRATLSHKDSDPKKIKDNDYKLIGKADNTFNPSYSIAYNSYPIRRHLFRVVVVNRAEETSAPATSEVVWRLPVDLTDFARDVDFTIIQAQLQIPGFGNNGSSGVVNGRGSGSYDYKAGITGSKNVWRDYNSFETVLTGAPRIEIDVASMGAAMTGPMKVSGLYTGVITYNKLTAKDGGKVIAGEMTVEYNHPTKGKLSETWEHTVAGGKLLSVVLESENKPSYPSYEEGGG